MLTPEHVYLRISTLTGEDLNFYFYLISPIEGNPISIYQVSSAKLERQSTQRMKSIVPRWGFEPESCDFWPGILTT